MSWKRYLTTSFFYLLFIASIVAGFVGLYLLQTVITVKRVEVVNNGARRAVVGLDGLTGMNMLLLDTQEVEKALKAQNPYIKAITLTKRYPDSVDVLIEQYQPAVALQADAGYFLLADDARLLEKKEATPSGYPLITSYQKQNFLLTQAGTYINLREITLAIRFTNIARNLGIAIDSIDIAGFHMIRLSAKDKVVLLSAEKDPKIQEYQLETLVKELRISGADFSTIDVRFDKPVYRLAPTKP